MVQNYHRQKTGMVSIAENHIFGSTPVQSRNHRFCVQQPVFFFGNFSTLGIDGITIVFHDVG